jgi:hypothetical protein
MKKHEVLTMVMALIMTAATVRAADLYITPEGAGTKDGSNWENAFSYNSEETGLQRAWDSLTAGSTLFVGGGDYAAKPLILKADGKTEAEIRRLVGVEQNDKLPTFTGIWEKTDKASGFALITVAKDSSWWAIENIVISKCRDGIVFESPGRIADGLIKNIAMTEMREGIILDGGAQVLNPETGTHNILIKDFRIENYVKRGIRIKNGCYNITLENCYADAGGKDWATEPFHMSYSIQGGGEGIYDHDITFINCEARNNYHDAGDGYWNADGFCAEGNVYNIVYIGCKSFDNTDGGWDDKSMNPLLIGCVAMRNKKNFRFWSGDPGAVFIRCLGAFAHKRGGNSEECSLWTRGKVKVYKSSFVGNPNSVFFNEWRLKPGEWEKMDIQIVDSIVTLPPENQKTIDKIGKTNSEIWSALPREGEALGYARPEEANKLLDAGTAFDSIKFGPAKGYNSSWVNENLLVEGRKLQPLIKMMPKKLPAKPVSIFNGKNPSGWYYSGWKGAEMQAIIGKGKDSNACLGVNAPKKTGGGASYQTKRPEATVDLTAREPAAWVIKLYIRGAAGQDFGTPQMGVVNLNKNVKLQELPIPARLDGSVANWQEVKIPLQDFLINKSDNFDSFSGITVRSGGGHAEPLYVDNITLEPM